MSKKKRIDWKLVEGEFRAGQLSIREIAKQHECSDTAIRKKMNALGVSRDLSNRVAEKVRTELVRSEVRTANQETEREIVTVAAARSVEVVRSHRIKIHKGTTVVEKLLDDLYDVIDHREEIEEDIVIATENEPNAKRQKRMMRAVSIQQQASTAVSLSAALKNLVAIERQAFNLSDKVSQDDDLPVVITHDPGLALEDK